MHRLASCLLFKKKPNSLQWGRTEGKYGKMAKEFPDFPNNSESSGFEVAENTFV
jgi:hypothetical protein